MINLNSKITLENNKSYLLTNDTFYGGIRYLLAYNMVDGKITNESIIFEEVIKGQDMFVDIVDEPELKGLLYNILQ